ncbi:F-box/LRR-repeat protein 7-like isoform X2 [Schistocerca gregaria]|uniref:F-box/LRR-repeat protein 7-like isoform X2 n=1 Tax=Schistocerca gregaria TaxID=7010 RepID=UPI00211F0A06|nr:F-box/LRR-repeat protein 7-like isoform X2 [Schistocerca gregaria]
MSLWCFVCACECLITHWITPQEEAEDGSSPVGCYTSTNVPASVSDRRPLGRPSPHPVPSASLWCGSGLDSGMASESEHSGLCHMAEGAAAWRASIDDLPEEILIKIFSHLSFTELVDVVRKVCRRWRKLSRDLKLWADKEYHVGISQHCNSENCKSGRTEREAIRIFRSARNLRKVHMWCAVSPHVIDVLCDKCRRLTDLRLHAAQMLGYSTVKNLVEQCSGLRVLTAPDELLKTEKFSEAVSRLQHLRVLSLQERYVGTTCILRPCVLRPLGDGCPRLVEIDFGRMSVDTDNLKYFLNAKKNTLKCLRIKWSVGGTRRVVPLLPVYADSLERLELYEYDIVRDSAREAFTTVGSLKNLRELRMSIPDRIPPGTAALAFTNGGLPQLKVLDLPHGYGVEDNTVIAISHGCPALRQLSVTHATKLSPAAFSEIDRLEHLEILDVTGCSRLGGGLFPCLVGLPRLHTLRMGTMYFGTTYFTELQPGVSSILKLSGLHCLTFDYSDVTGVPFDKFPENLVSLRELSVEGCQGDPRATDGLMEQMPNLVIRGTIHAELQPFHFEALEDLGPGEADEAVDDRSESDEDGDSDSSVGGSDSERG